jgi:NADH-quinone oxidoreductase subunit L
MEAMGGLRKYLPVTHVTFLISCLAISGIPFFSGFSSKDEIITACMAYNPAVGYIMTAIAAMTAFYMFRLYYGIFWGTENRKLHEEHTPHEESIMTMPLVVLSIITVGVGVYTTLAGFGMFEGYSFGSLISADGHDYRIHFDTSVASLSTVIAICSILLATYIFKGETQPVADKMYAAAPRLHCWAYKRFYMDEVYQFITHRIIFAHVSRPIAWFDRHVIDGFFNFLAWGTHALSFNIRTLQSGRVQQYALVFLIGVLILILMIL